MPQDHCRCQKNRNRGPPALDLGTVLRYRLLALSADKKLGPLAGLGSDTRALVIGTEGASDPTIYRQLTGLAPRADADPFEAFTGHGD